MKNKKILILAIATTLCFLLSFLFSYSEGRKTHDRFPVSIAKLYSKAKVETRTTIIKKTISADQLSRINISLISTDVKFVSSTNPKEIQIEYQSYGNLELKDQIEGNTLSLIETKKSSDEGSFHFVFSDQEATKLVIAVPEKIDTLALKAVSSNVQITHPKMEKVMVESISGDLDLSQLKVNALEAKTVSGDLHFKGEANRILSRSISGDQSFELTGAAPSETTLESTSGNLKVAFQGKSDATIRFSSLSGELRTSLGGLKPADGRHFEAKVGTGKNILNLKTISGDVEVSGP